MIASSAFPTITVVYDNRESNSSLKTDWGFSAWITFQGTTLLFDTGAKGRILRRNLRTLDLDPAEIEQVFLSHAHDDHTGGLKRLLRRGARPIVNLHPSFPAKFKRCTGRRTDVREVAPGQALGDSLYTTGELHNRIEEHSLVIKTSLGLILVTGCAHPGIVKIIRRATELFDEKVYLAMGGFHLRSKNEEEITAILSQFRSLGVEKVAPSHCTGDLAIEMFAKEYGKDFIDSGIGKVIHVEE
jgi:7,8-dihydropterin-6-yl-methyl-4-(beta-D-ribofuranosyl)aminobenzene 5'-phosphate synthase